VLPFAMIVILMALETLVAFLQAYVFAILTCIYLTTQFHRATDGPFVKSSNLREFGYGSNRSEIHRAGIACIGRGRRRRCRHHLRQLSGAALRNPSAAQGQFGNLIFGFAITEALGIFSAADALLLLFAL